MTYSDKLQPTRRKIAGIWSYASILFVLVGATSVSISHSAVLLLPVAVVCVLGGIIGTLMLRLHENADERSGNEPAAYVKTALPSFLFARPKQASVSLHAAEETLSEMAQRLEAAVPRHIETKAASREHPGRQILKSGIVEGMVYRLYTDGSIEVELGNRLLTSPSLEDLRAQMERAK